MNSIRMVPFILGTLFFSLAFFPSLCRAAEGHSMPMGHMAHGMAGNYNDRAFLSGMIVHHEAAVDMAMEAMRAGKDPQVIAWAESIVKDQDREITLMKGWLEEKGGEDQAAAQMMKDEMKDMMAKPAGKGPDYDFVAMMTPHHAGALTMAADALTWSDDQRVVDLAEQIIIAQTKEIVQFRKWLAGRN